MIVICVNLNFFGETCVCMQSIGCVIVICVNLNFLGETCVCMQSMGLPTYCRVVTITEKVSRITNEMHLRIK